MMRRLIVNEWNSPNLTQQVALNLIKIYARQTRCAK